MAARQGLASDGIALQYLQLDDWWYAGHRPPYSKSSGRMGSVQCVGTWEMPTDTYPGGLAALHADSKLPLLLYGPYFCAENQWNQTLVPVGADAGVPPPEESHSFYSKVFDWVVGHGGRAYEVDFMSNLVAKSSC
jgi:hypothetical protein